MYGSLMVKKGRPWGGRWLSGVQEQTLSCAHEKEPVLRL